MARSKRKWKKDSPEKLATRMDKSIDKEKEKEVRLSKFKPKSPEITSPESKKSKNQGTVSTESSFDTNPDSSLIISDSQVSVYEVTDDTVNQTTPPQIATSSNSEENGVPPTNGVLGTNEVVGNGGETAPPNLPTSNSTQNPNTESSANIGETLRTITQSLDTLTKSVITITNNMVSKTDLSEMKKSVFENEKKIAENSEVIKSKFSRDEGLALQKKVKNQDKILNSHEADLHKLQEDLENVVKTQGAAVERDQKMSHRIDGLAAANNKIQSDLKREIDDLKAKMLKQDAEIITLRNGQQVNNFPQNGSAENTPPPQPIHYHQVHDKLNVIIEGLQENDDEDLPRKVLTLFEQIGVKTDENDISSVTRIKRKTPLGNKPNPVKLSFKNLPAKERVMSAKFKLKQLQRHNIFGLTTMSLPISEERRAGRASLPRLQGKKVQQCN